MKRWQWDCGLTIFNTEAKYSCHLWQCKFDQDFTWTPHHTPSKLAWQFLCESAFNKGLMPHIPACIVSTLVRLFCLLLMFIQENVNCCIVGMIPKEDGFLILKSYSEPPLCLGNKNFQCGEVRWPEMTECVDTLLGMASRPTEDDNSLQMIFHWAVRNQSILLPVSKISLQAKRPPNTHSLMFLLYVIFADAV